MIQIQSDLNVYVADIIEVIWRKKTLIKNTHIGFLVCYQGRTEQNNKKTWLYDI